MTHLPDLIQDLGLILIAAAVVTLLFKKLKQPVVLGYLIVGFFVGPHFDFLPTVKDTESIRIWAEIGVIFMLFSLGLEFSFKKLARVGKSASITAAFEIGAMLGVGYLVGQLLNWSRMDSLFLGGILSISSTTIIVRAFDELGLKSQKFVSLVFGVLIVEDLIAILLLVLLSSVAVTQSLSGVELLTSTLRLGFFLVLWFLLGIYLIPVFLRRYREALTDETLLIISIALCFLMVSVANTLGFSPALGAFVMGSILAETPKRQRIEHLIQPVRDLFSAVFFVSVGMLIDPSVLIESYDVILLISVVTIIGKFLSSALGALISGQSVRNSVQSGMSLAQIGEFSFIIATLGVTLKVTSSFLYPIAVAVSAVTTFTTPYLIRYSGDIYLWLSRRIPSSVMKSLEHYEATMATTSGAGVISILWRAYGIKILLNTVVVIAITIGMRRWVYVKVSSLTDGGGTYLSWVLLGVTLLLSGPFLWAIVAGRPSTALVEEQNQVQKLRQLQIGIWVLRLIAGVLLVGFLMSQFISVTAFSGVAVMCCVLLSVLFVSRYSEAIYRRIEARFVENLTENERAEIERQARKPKLAPWDATLAEVVVSPDSPYVMKTILDSSIRDQFGVTIALIERGSTRILPKKTDLFLPFDRLYLIGTDEQIDRARVGFEKEEDVEHEQRSHTLGLSPYRIEEGDVLVGQSIRECRIRERIGGSIVGVERDGKRSLSPEASFVFAPGDLLWIVGDPAMISTLRDQS